LTYQFDDFFGRLSGDLEFLNKSFWVIDSVLWMLVIILCAVAILSSGKASPAKDHSRLQTGTTP
jgi:hypothetical protein